MAAFVRPFLHPRLDLLYRAARFVDEPRAFLDT
jgi:hypothetical protein